MSNGGPDGEGVYVQKENGFSLGHRRLSIIDLTEGANQPMSYLNNRYWITFNGEIYNYKSLRKQLIDFGYYFKTESDTEILLAGYDYWKEELLSKLEGMFAFLIADNIEKKLFVARDHMGIKPLYFGKIGNEFYFSSEIRGLLAIDPNWKPNPNWRIWFLTFGFLPEPITTLYNVKPVSKGSYMIFNLETHDYVEQIWYKPKYSVNNDSIDNAIKKTNELVRDSVKKHLIADVEVGVFLSGGIDSSIIAMLAKENSNSRIKTISIDFEDTLFSEKQYQDDIVSRINSDHYSFTVSKNDFVRECNNIFESLDQPSTDSINSYFICKYAKQLGLKVVLSGLGADEIFGGYPSFHRCKKFTKINRISALFHLMPDMFLTYPTKKLKFLKNQINSSEYLLYRGLFTPKDTAAILNINEEDVWKVLSNFKLPVDIDKSIQLKTRISILESDIYMLNQLLKDSDNQSMWHGIELRVPFVDIKLLEYVSQLDDKIKYPDKQHKYLLINAFKSILPEFIWNRPKQGFVFPFQLWMKSMNLFQNAKYIPSQFYNQFKTDKINHTRLWAIFICNTYKEKINFNDSIKEIEPTEVFIYLSAFKQIGGIETVNRSIMYCLNRSYSIPSYCIGLHDKLCDQRYLPPYYFKGFSGKRIQFLFYLIRNSRSWNKVIAGHINLAPAIYLMKKLNPSLEIIVIAHGIEVWDKQKKFNKWLLNKANKIISVSEYTKHQLNNNSGITNEKIDVFHNSLDPFFTIPVNLEKPSYLQNRHGLVFNDKVVFTLSRLSSNEKYKGYDKVIDILIYLLKNKMPSFKYLLGGIADDQELKRLKDKITLNNLENNVILVGYIPEDELKDYFLVADLFVMPSKKEGFGIVFIESAVCGTSVVAGNKDGSVEALLNGSLGTLVNPDSTSELLDTINTNLFKPNDSKKSLQKKASEMYQFNNYENNFINHFK